MKNAKIDSREYPFFFYFKRAGNIPLLSIIFKTDEKDLYLLKRVAFQWPELLGGSAADTPRFSLIYGDSKLSTQNSPVPADLLTTPGENARVPAAPFPSQAGRRKILYTFNYLFAANSTVEIQVQNSAVSYPEYYEIVVEGRKIPIDSTEKRARGLL
jgi:hypothetical protein